MTNTALWELLHWDVTLSNPKTGASVTTATWGKTREDAIEGCRVLLSSEDGFWAGWDATVSDRPIS